MDLLLYIMLLNFPLLKFWGPESIHNIYNVPLELEPERAAKARRAVVASEMKNENGFFGFPYSIISMRGSSFPVRFWSNYLKESS